MFGTIEVKLSEPQLALLQQHIDATLSQIVTDTKRQMPKRQYLNKKELCEYIGISFNTLQSWIQQGLPIHTINHVTRFSIPEVDKWIQKQQ